MGEHRGTGRAQDIAPTMDFPLPKSCGRLGEMEEPPSGGNVLQATQASPDDLDPWFAITHAPQEPSQASNPVDGLVQGRRLLGKGVELAHKNRVAVSTPKHLKRGMVAAAVCSYCIVSCAHALKYFVTNP
jgi:hypothetical protein